LLGYWAKALPNIPASRSIGELLARLDRRMFRGWPGSTRYAANFNVIYVK
jgi:hypothetical protein